MGRRTGIKTTAPRRIGDRSSLSRGGVKGYQTPEVIGKQPYYWWQGIGRIQAGTVPNIAFTVAYTNETWEGTPLNQGDAATTSPQFLIDSQGYLICDRTDCENFEVDQSSGDVIYTT